MWIQRNERDKTVTKQVGKDWKYCKSVGLRNIIPQGLHLFLYLEEKSCLTMVAKREQHSRAGLYSCFALCCQLWESPSVLCWVFHGLFWGKVDVSFHHILVGWRPDMLIVFCFIKAKKNWNSLPTGLLPVLIVFFSATSPPRPCHVVFLIIFCFSSYQYQALNLNTSVPVGT